MKNRDLLRNLYISAASVSALALMADPACAAVSFVTGVINTYATQAVTGSSGAITVPAAGITYTTPTVSVSTGTAGSFLITFTLPTGVTFSITPTVTVGGNATTCTANATLAPSGGGNGANTAVFTIPTNATTTVGDVCTVALNAFTIAGATALQSVVSNSASASKSGFAITEQVSASTGTSPTFNQAASLGSGIANSVNALTFASSGVVPAIINVLPPSNGTKISQGAPITTTNVAYADLGAINTTLTVSQNATATGQFTFTGTTTTVVLTGNFTGATNAYIAPVGTLSCASSFAAKPSGSLVGTLSGNTITVSGAGAGFNAAAGVAQVQEVCVYYTGTTIVGANPLAAPIVTTASVDTTTVTMSSVAPLATETYNGVVTQIAYTGKFTSYPAFIRVVNNTAAAIQAFAVVQSDTGILGQGAVETALAANNNDLVSVSTILTTAGVTPTNGRVSLILLGPTGVVFENLILSPNGTLVQIN